MTGVPLATFINQLKDRIMGYRLHSAIKYEVSYGSDAYFNMGSNYINRIIECLAEDTFWCNDSEYYENADEIEADRETLLKNLPRILNPDYSWGNQDELDYVIEEMENNSECGIDRQYLHDGLKSLIESADSNNSFVRFSWF